MVHVHIVCQLVHHHQLHKVEGYPASTLRAQDQLYDFSVIEVPPDEFISREVDPILDKISAHGIHSLTERERQVLEAARSKMAKR